MYSFGVGKIFQLSMGSRTLRFLKGESCEAPYVRAAWAGTLFLTTILLERRAVFGRAGHCLFWLLAFLGSASDHLATVPWTSDLI